MRIARTLSPGHPDRACDLIAETIVDEYLRRDPDSRLRVCVSGGKGALFVTGMVVSKADFDVGTIAVRAAGALGTRGSLEPFVALEPAAGGSQALLLRRGKPVAVSGYATVETPEGVPFPVALSRRLAKRLDALRAADADWFWLEPGFDVSVVERAPGEAKVILSCAHGTMDVGEAREKLRQIIAPLCNSSDIRINPGGSAEAWGLDADIGASGTPTHPYGSALPIVTAFAGLDPSHPSKCGSWLARALARQALARNGSKAVLVQALYDPGDDTPSLLRVRDERGRDVSEPDDLARMSQRGAAFQRPGLNAEAVRWGFAGETGLPWEAS